MKFKTTAKCGGCSAAIINALKALAPESEWSVDLASPDKILTYSGSKPLQTSEIVAAVEGAGFKCEPIG